MTTMKNDNGNNKMQNKNKKKINLVFFKNNISLEFNQQVPFNKKPGSRISKNHICKLDYYSTNQRPNSNTALMIYEY